MTEDVTLVKQGKVAVFTYTTADLAALPVFLGTISSSALTGLTKSLGGLSPVYAKNRRRAGVIDIVSTIRDAPDLGDLTLEERMHKAAINHLEAMAEADCQQTWLVKMDDCGGPDDPDTFNSVLLINRVRIADIDYGSLQSFDANDIATLTSTLNHEGVGRIIAINFTEFSDVALVAEALDVIYADEISCGACAPFSDGCNQTYVLTRANTSSPGLSSQIVYSIDGHTTWAAVDIPPLGGVDGSRLEAVGKRLVVISESTVSHFYINKANISDPTLWTEVTSGYQAGGGPRAIFAKSPTEVFIGGADGYIYKSTSVTTSVVVKHDASLTAQNCNDIHAIGQFVLAGFDSNTILFSINNGETYSLLTTDASLNGPEAGANITAVWVINDNQWYVATNTGNLYYTDDQGATFTQRNLPGQNNITVINDIKFAPDFDQVGAVAVEVNGAGRVYRTISGGRTWFDDDPGIDGMQSLDALRVNAVALCGANEIAAAGIKSTGSPDGLLAIAK